MPHHAPTPPADGFEPNEIELARAIVAGFVSARPWLREERDDLTQECLEHWLRQRHRYDAARGASAATFMRRVLNRRLRDIEEKRTAEKRGGGAAPESLDREDRGAVLHDSLSAAEDTEAGALLKVALDRARCRLTPDQSALTGALLEGHSMIEIVRATARARSSLYRDLERIRAIFKDEGLDELLCKDRPTRPDRSDRLSV